jgi:Flp pilus assembly protein TadG
VSRRPSEINQVLSPATSEMSEMKGVKSWFEQLMSRDRRRGERHEAPPVVAYYWDGAAPAAHPIRDISSAGFYLLTEQRWYVGTMITMTLQKTGGANTGSEASIAVQARVVRLGADGVGLAFVLQPPQQGRHSQGPLANGADRKTLDRFLRPLFAEGGIGPGGEQAREFQVRETEPGEEAMKILSDERGQMLVLVALSMTFLMGFMALAIDVGVLFRAKRNVQIAADAAAVAGALDYQYNQSISSAKAAAQTAATANGVTNGTDGVVVTINTPPLDGPNTGSTGFVEAIITQPNSTVFAATFAALFHGTSFSTVTVAARAVAGGSTNSGCVWTLATSGADIAMTGSGTISIPACDVFDNSDSGDALQLTGSGSLTAKAIGIVGGYSEVGSGSITPTPVTGTAPASNPLASLPAPAVPSSTGTGCVNYTGQAITPGCWNNVSFSGSADHSLPAGTYVFNGGLSNVGSGTLTLGAGNYIINGGLSNSGSGGLTLGAGDYTINGNFQDTGSGALNLGAGLYIVTGNLGLTGSGSLNGAGVTFYTEGSTSVTGSSSVDLTAPTSGTYDGVLFFQATTDNNPIQITGSSNMELQGIIYAPDANLSFTGSGSSTISTDLVVDSVTFTGSTSFQDYAALNTTSVLSAGKLSLVE